MTEIKPPAGFQRERDDKLWHVGFVFKWSDVFEKWLDCGWSISVKPGETVAAAWRRECGTDDLRDFDVFFVDR